METSTKILMAIAGFFLVLIVCTGLMSFFAVEESTSSAPTMQQNQMF